MDCRPTMDPHARIKALRRWFDGIPNPRTRLKNFFIRAKQDPTRLEKLREIIQRVKMIYLDRLEKRRRLLQRQSVEVPGGDTAHPPPPPPPPVGTFKSFQLDKPQPIERSIVPISALPASDFERPPATIVPSNARDRTSSDLGTFPQVIPSLNDRQNSAPVKTSTSPTLSVSTRPDFDA